MEQLQDTPTADQAPETAPGTLAEKPDKKPALLKFNLASIDVKKTAGGHDLYVMSGTEFQGRDGKPKKAIAYQEVGEPLAAALKDAGVDIQNLEKPVAVDLTGKWTPRNWTDREGKPHKGWEFKVESFELAAREAEATKEEPKEITMFVTKAEEKVVGKDKVCLNLTGVNDKGQKTRAVAWDQTARQLSGDIAQAANNEGMVATRVTLRGRWKTDTFKGEGGVERKSFEFVVKEFDGPMPTAFLPEAAPRKKKAAAQEGPTM